MKINSYQGVDNVNFGFSREEVQQALYPHHSTLFKRFEEEPASDYFEDLGLFVYYDDNGKCDAIEFADEQNIFCQELELFKYPYSQLEAFFLNLDSELKIDSSGFTSYKLGIGVYSPFLKESRESKIKSVIVFKEGYYGDVT